MARMRKLIQPVACSRRMQASTNGRPVRPSAQARKRAASNSPSRMPSKPRFMLWNSSSGSDSNFWMKWQCQCRRASKAVNARRRGVPRARSRSQAVRCSTSRIDSAPTDSGTDSREQACGAVFGLLMR